MGRTTARKWFGRPGMCGLVAVLALACSEGPAGPGPEPDNPADVDEYVGTLGSWEEFAEPVDFSNAPVPDSTAAVVEEVVEEDDGTGVMHEVTYVCTETPYSLTDTPEALVMYEPNASIMWVGALIQGESYKGGTGSFQELPIRQRAPLKISIDLLTGDNSATVEDPSLTSVGQAIGELIERAHNNGHRSGSSIDYQERVTHSVEQAALSLGLSAKYLGASARASLSTSRKANERTLLVHFVQSMFTIAMELPQSPDAVFSDELTDALLQAQIDAGNIGRSNLPVYLASVTYGRTLTYSLTSTHSEARMKAAISASYDGLVGGASGYTEAELQETLSQQNIKVVSIGGEGQNVLDLISTGNLQAYFTEDAPLTSARPLSYQLNFLGDNSIAKVGETTSYTLRTCEEKVVIPGRFEFMSVQQGSAPVSTPYRIQKGDLNGDGHGDLVWNHLTSGTNQAAVGFGTAAGGFDVKAGVSHPASPAEGWSGQYDLLVADFTGDGSDDLLWNRRGTENRIFLAVSQGDGTFDFLDEVVHPVPSWGTEWRVLTGDFDADGIADLAWSALGQLNQTYVALSNGDGTFEFGDEIVHSAQSWGPYVTHIADVNGDLRDDLVWNVSDGGHTNRTYVGRSLGDGTFDLMPHQDRGSTWDGYVTRIGDINRDGNDDVLWVATERPEMAIHRGFGQPDATFQFPGYQGIPRYDSGPLDTYVGDFNDDGSIDILWNDLSANVNHMWVGLGNEAGLFDFTPVDQEHPATDASGVDWSAFEGGVHILDVDNDGIDDVVWIARSGTYLIYVALGKDAGV